MAQQASRFEQTDELVKMLRQIVEERESQLVALSQRLSDSPMAGIENVAGKRRDSILDRLGLSHKA